MKRTKFKILHAVAAIGFLWIIQTGAVAQDLASSTRAEPEQPSRPPPPTPYGFQQIIYDLNYLGKRPFHLDERDGLWIAGTFAMTGALYAYRENIRDWALKQQTENRSDFFNDVRIMGKGAFAPCLALAAYGASFLTNNDREKETAFLVIESAALSQAAALIGQTIIASERPPDESVRILHYGGHGVSGDAALAASVIPPLRRQYLRVMPDDSIEISVLKWAVSGLLYTGAALTAYQRIDSDSHWAPDAFLGMMAGLAVGNVLCESHDKAKQEREKREKQPRITLGAMPGGLMVHFRF